MKSYLCEDGTKGHNEQRSLSGEERDHYLTPAPVLALSRRSGVSD